jgi:hypothetical protein
MDVPELHEYIAMYRKLMQEDMYRIEVFRSRSKLERENGRHVIANEYLAQARKLIEQLGEDQVLIAKLEQVHKDHQQWIAERRKQHEAPRAEDVHNIQTRIA